MTRIRLIRTNICSMGMNEDLIHKPLEGAGCPTQPSHDLIHKPLGGAGCPTQSKGIRENSKEPMPGPGKNLYCWDPPEAANSHSASPVY